jgi:hypothetical protein
VALPKEGYGWKAYAFNLAAHTALYTGLMYYRYHALEHAEDGKPDPATALNLAIASGAVTLGS